jgi:hypothetical protein
VGFFPELMDAKDAGALPHLFPPIDWRDHPNRSEIPLADGRWKLAWHRGFYTLAYRIWNHLFFLTY